MTALTTQKADVARRSALSRAKTHVHPARMDLLNAMKLNLVAARSEGYRVWDMDGREFLDMDLRAGVYNLGHRHPQMVTALAEALEYADMGFALFPGDQESALAEKLTRSSGTQYAIFTPSGTEANDMAIRSARRFTGKRRIVSASQGYHGASGLASAAGNPGFARSFVSDYPDEFTTVPVNDAGAIEAELSKGDVAALILEPVCNAAAYPTTPEGYWPAIRELCDSHGVVLIMDEIVTGLGRSGKVWGHQAIGIQPDIVVTGKGLSGGIYPIAATLLSGAVGQWLAEDSSGYAGTFAGGELACAVGSAAFDLSTSPETLEHANAMASKFREGLEAIRRHRPIISDIRQFGFLFAVEFDREGAGLALASHLFAKGVLTFPAVNAPSSLNLKLGHLVDQPFCHSMLERLDQAIGELA